MAQEESPDAGRRGRRILAASVAAILLLAGAFAVGRLTAPVAGTPSTTSAEAGFARDMQIHHNQGVQLAMLVRDLTDNEEVRLLAYDIATAQGQQSGQLYGMLAEWHLPQAAAEPSMTWMTRPTLSGEAHGHGGTSAHQPGEPMPGLATAAQIAKLADLSGVEAESYFLELMIAHHRGAIEMAQALLDRSDFPTSAAIATGIIASQQSEIQYMEDLLAQRQ